GSVRFGYPNLNEARSQYVAGGKKSRADELVQLNGFFIGNLSKLLEGSGRVFFGVQGFGWFVFGVALSICVLGIFFLKPRRVRQQHFEQIGGSGRGVHRSSKSITRQPWQISRMIDVSV